LISSTETTSFSLMMGTTPAFEQFEQRVAGVEMAPAVLEVVVGQQHLADAALLAGEQLVVGGHEARLSDGGGHLEGGQVGGLLFHAQRLQAAGDGAGGDHDDFAAFAAQGGETVHQGGHAAGVGAAVALHEHAAADLHDDAPGSRQFFPCRKMGHDGGQSAKRPPECKAPKMDRHWQDGARRGRMDAGNLHDMNAKPIALAMLVLAAGCGTNRPPQGIKPVAGFDLQAVSGQRGTRSRGWTTCSSAGGQVRAEYALNRTARCAF
jgi:hypothetical protein